MQVTVPQKHVSVPLVIVLLAIAYFATGWVGLTWAIETVPS